MRFDSRATFARTEVDVAAVHRVADQMVTAAEIIERVVGDHLTRLTFSGATAGRAHAARGDVLRAQLERLVSDVSQWSRAAVEIAGALRTGAERYADAEMYAAARIA
jgi:hypothetical protein